jgi:DNA-binding NarL/FixJ family response regulator
MDVHLDALTADVQLWLDHETATGAITATQGLAKAEVMVATAGDIGQLDPAARTAYLAVLEAAGDAALQEDRGGDVLHLAGLTVLVASGLEPEEHIAALIRAGFALQPLGRASESEARYREAWELARRVVSPSAMVDAGHGLARALRNLGRLAEAHAIASENARLEGRLGTAPRRWGNAASALHSIELSLGDPDRALAALRHDFETDPDPHFRLGIHETIATWLARFHGQRVGREVVNELAAAESDAAVARCPRCSSELAIVSAEILARIGKTADARLKRASWQGSSGGSYLMGEVWRLRADAAIELSEGDTLKALETLDELIAALTAAGLLEQLIWAHLDRGAALASIDRGRSIEAFAQAAALSADIGAVSQERLAARALRRLGVRAWRRKPSSGEIPSGANSLRDLSPREREIAALVAEGMSNREIAESLLVSPKTVERHLTNVLSKVGLRNRTELATRVSATLVRDSPDE